MPFRLGLVGGGRMGRTHMRALADSELVAVTAIAEVSQAARAAVAAPGVSVHASITEMLADAALDGVLITAPTDQHRVVVAQVAAAGLPILCEKPCGLTAQQARASAEVVADAGVPFQVAYWRRYVPALRQLRAAIAAGELGTVLTVACYQWDEGPAPLSFRAHSGGIAIDMGVHEFDQLRWLTGEDIVSMTAVGAGPDPDGLPDVESLQAIATLSGGGSAVISLGRYYPAGDAVWAQAFGTGGSQLCPVIDPADGERVQLAALRSQAEGFAAFAGGAPCDGATAADAIAALVAAEQVAAAVSAMAGQAAPWRAIP